MVSQKKVVTPVKTGVQLFLNYLKTLDSGFRRNDAVAQFLIFHEAIIFALYQKPEFALAQQILKMEHARQLAVVIGHRQKGDFVALHDA